MKEALFYNKLPGNIVQCLLCPYNCRITDGKYGICEVRKYIDGTLFALNANRLIAAHVDPMEKKPLYHFFPGDETFSIAAAGCNFRCRNCQNSTISQATPGLLDSGEPTSPEMVVEMAKQRGLHHITFTYTEPTVFYELMLKTAELASREGFYCSVVSNGFINPEPLARLLPFISGANIDLKFASDKLYRSVTGGWRDPVVETIRTLFEHGIVTEVTTLIIPGLNDSEREFGEIGQIILDISPKIPWHLSAFYPTYKMTDRSPTPPETLTQLRQTALNMGMQHVYTGNIIDPEGSITYCPKCHTELIQRHRLSFHSTNLKNGHCPTCGAEIYGRF
ncbi:MAG: AmmeMemoRadiSam system radical SAM enzyme [Acidobacteria bacterium]|nr:AmmeMemoRadiSam system radical SAM enzyme [Acidobacteriota bacterium]